MRVQLIKHIGALRRISLSALIMCCGALMFPQKVPALEVKAGEYQVKAAFIYNFAKFIDWPSGSDGMTLCLLGEDPFDRDIDIIRGKPVKGRALAVKRIKAVQEAAGCKILFISPAMKAGVTQIVAELKGSHVLTIGDTEGFAQQGVIINFYLEGENVRFEINIEAAKHAGIQISSNLLKLARIVKGKKL